MNVKLKKFIHWWFGANEDWPKKERLLFILSWSMFYLNILLICFPKRNNYNVIKDYNWVLFVIVLLLQLAFGGAGATIRHRRLKRSQV